MTARLIALAALMAAGLAHADETCHFERKVLFLSERPKATMVKRPPLIGPPAAPKPAAKRVKRLDGPRKDGYDWVCEDIAAIDPLPFERVALLAPVAEEASPAAPSFADFVLPLEPTGAGVAEPSSYAAAPAVFFGGGGLVFVGSPVFIAGPVVYAPITAVAEPESYALILLGLAAVILWKRRS